MGKLALLGGAPVRTRAFPSQNTIGAKEKAAVIEVLESGVLSKFLGEPDQDFYGGPQVQRTEQAYAEYFGAKFAVTTNSATTALHAAVAACGLGPGDEVIVSPFTMTASATAILMQNVVPVFADIHPQTFCLDPEAVRRAITSRTRAIMMVDLFGQPAHWDEIRALAKSHNLKIIEDAAQAANARYYGRLAGTLGDIGVISLNYHKIIHCGEGGVILTSNPELAERAQLVRNHGEAVVEGLGLSDITNTFGSNYRMTEIDAAIARCQLDRLPGLFEHRERLAAYLSQRLRGLAYITVPHVESNVTSTYYLYAVKLCPELGVSRRTFVRALNAEGIPFGEGYVRPLYLQPMYQQRAAYNRGCPWTCGHYQGSVSYAPGICPVAERMYDCDLIVGMVCHPPQTEADMDDIVRAFDKILSHLQALRSGEAEGAHEAADPDYRSRSWRR